jgi:hypothetical protein
VLDVSFGEVCLVSNEVWVVCACSGFACEHGGMTRELSTGIVLDPVDETIFALSSSQLGGVTGDVEFGEGMFEWGVGGV